MIWWFHTQMIWYILLIPWYDCKGSENLCSKTCRNMCYSKNCIDINKKPVAYCFCQFNMWSRNWDWIQGILVQFWYHSCCDLRTKKAISKFIFFVVGELQQLGKFTLSIGIKDHFVKVLRYLNKKDGFKRVLKFCSWWTVSTWVFL